MRLRSRHSKPPPSSTVITATPIRTDSGAVILPLPWSVAPSPVPRLGLAETELVAKDELHLTLLGSAEANRLDAVAGKREAWRVLCSAEHPDGWRATVGGEWWLLRAHKPDGVAWSVIALAHCAAWSRFRARAAEKSRGEIRADAPAHVTLYVAGCPRGIGLPSRTDFERFRLRRLTPDELPPNA